MTQARDVYRQALSQQPSPQLEARLHAGIANTSYWLDDYSTAIAEWNTAYPNLEDPAVKSFVLYRVGICQQRLGQFAQADQTFGTVQQQYPSTDAAKRARERLGAKGFTLQLATYANAASADAEIAKLQKQGMSPSRGKNAQGNTVVSIGPMANYAQAMDMKNRMAGELSAGDHCALIDFVARVSNPCRAVLRHGLKTRATRIIPYSPAPR